jgi:hypothetical protein
MSMTKKDYVAIAAVINKEVWRDGNDPATMACVAVSLACLFSDASISFQYDRFINACLDEPSQEVSNV